MVKDLKKEYEIINKRSVETLNHNSIRESQKIIREIRNHVFKMNRDFDELKARFYEEAANKKKKFEPVD